VRFVWKHLPLDIHRDAPAAHMASMAAHKQGKFWEFREKLFANQKSLNPETFRKHAEDLGLNMDEFDRELGNLDNKEAIDKDKSEASSMGVTGTPGFFVNGRYLRGAKPFEEFAKLINAELTERGLPVPPEAQGG
jgi:protein-disulfide isomerase